MSKLDARAQAEFYGEKAILERQAARGQICATLDLADAIREAGKNVADGLRGIEVSIVRYTEAVQDLD